MIVAVSSEAQSATSFDSACGSALDDVYGVLIGAVSSEAQNATSFDSACGSALSALDDVYGVMIGVARVRLFVVRCILARWLVGAV